MNDDQRSRPDDATGDSLIHRLQRKYGANVDPGIELESDGGAPDRARSAVHDSSGVLSRLESRGGSSDRYRLQGEIARGGMGAILEVWDEDLRRKLAMKVALGRSGEGSSDSAAELDPRILARFLEEAQVTGQLEHPGIVPVHELGLGDDGQVYFTMRLVRGRDLEAIFGLVDEERDGWSVTRALGVLLKVCEAMTYAHSKGVIHRDLKPANVMVGHFGEVYVMDWGLVRVQGHEDRHDVRVTGDPAQSARIMIDRREDASGESGDELYTMDGDVVGTPAFMAPEQARGAQETIDERADVYSIGAMLYRLFAGTAPYCLRGEKRGAAAILEQLLEDPPESLEKLATDAPAELVAICEKAMAREPRDRYAGMAELAEDLRAFLEHRVVRAYEAGAMAEARKWVRRNRPFAAALAAGVLVLIGGLVVSLVQKKRADDNAVLAAQREQQASTAAALAEDRRIAADASAAAAQRQTRIAEEVNEFLNDDVFAAIAPEHQGIDVSLREVLDVAGFRLTGRFEDEPAVESELRMTIGTSYERLGEYESAGKHLERALELRREELGASEPTVQAMRAVASVWNELGRSAEAAELYGEAIEWLSAELGDRHRGTLSTKSDLGIVYSNLGRLEDARDVYREVLDTQRDELGSEHDDTLSTLNNLGLVLTDLGEYREAEGILTEVLELRRRDLGDDHPETLVAMSNVAELYRQDGRYEEAVALDREANDARVDVLGPEHPNTGTGYSNLGTSLLQLGRLVEAEEVLEEAREILTASLGEGHRLTLLATNNLAVAYERLGKSQDALELRERSLPLQKDALGVEHPDTLLSMSNLAVLYRSFDRNEEARELGQETLRLQREVLGEDHPSTLVTLENLGGLLYWIEDYAGSLELTGQVLESRKRVLGPDHPDVGKTTYNMGMIAKSMGDREQARSLIEEALAIQLAAVGEEHLNVAECHQQLGNLALDARQYDDSTAHYRKAIEIRRALVPDDEEVGYMLHQITYCAFTRKDWEAGIEVGPEAVEVRREVMGERHVETLVTTFILARCYFESGLYAECEPMALAFHEGYLAVEGPEHKRVKSGRKLLVSLYDAWGKPEEAERWR